MNYDFETVYNRKGTHCLKWDDDERYSLEKVLPMWVADMEFPTPECIVDALKKRVAHPFYSYTHDDGTFAEVTADWIKKSHHWNVEKEWVRYSHSVLSSLAIALQIFTERMDGVIIMPPVYYPFAERIEKLQRVVTKCPLLLKDGYYEIDFDNLEKYARMPEVKALVFCNPHNPVGRVFRAEEIRKVGEICLKNNVHIFSDEIHADLTLEDNKHIPFGSISKEIADITISAYSVSKTFNMAGINASSVIIPNSEIRTRFEEVRDSMGMGLIPCLSLEGYIAAYSQGREFVSQLKICLKNNRDFVAEYLKKFVPKIKAMPLEGTYLMWLDCRELNMSPTELETFMFDKALLSFDHGYWFGEEGNGFIRMNIACPRTMIEKALERLRSVTGES